MTKVLVLGAAGMLGRAVADVLGEDPALEVAPVTRSDFDAETGDVAELLDTASPAFVVNAIGLLRGDIDPERLNEVNGRFPLRLAEAASERGARVVHIGTDGVFSGMSGSYLEDAPHDATDPYALSKSAGEATGDHVTNIRCSIVGDGGLLGWLLAQPAGARVPGFTDQRWNGVTTVAFARVCAALARGEPPPPSPLHLVPADSMTKAELLESALRAFGRDDVTVDPRESGAAADRTLATSHPGDNDRLWRAAGYDGPPAIERMLRELAER